MTPRTSIPATREKLLQAAIQLFAEKGAAEATTAEVSQKAGVATGTLFNYFPSKIALIEAVYLDLKHAVAEEARSQADLDAEPVTLLRGVWTAYIRWALDHPAEHSVLSKLKTYSGLSPETRAKAEEAFDFAIAAMARSLEEGGLKPVPLELAGALFGANADATIEFLSARGGYDSEITDLVFQLLWDGLED